ncbi:hypothetical protein DFH09DRAFT_1137012 [Mycena vulgaris]|nr:hypothetical protein DFH09DRAFT_1137012 [Mycena vulgaris]
MPTPASTLRSLFTLTFIILSCGAVSERRAGHELPEGTYIATGEAALQTLADYLHLNPEVRVSRLLLSDAPANDSAGIFNAASTPENTTAASRNACDTISTLAHRIIHHTPNALTALAYLASACDDTSLPGSVGEREFPNLTELTLAAADVWRYQDALFGMKSLTHLHCASGNYDHAPPSLAVILQELPNLTHLRISGPQEDEDVPQLDRAPPSTGIELVDGVAGWIQQMVFNPSLVPHNFTLVIQPGPDPGSGDIECGFTSARYDSFVRRVADRADVQVNRLADAESEEDGSLNLGWSFSLDHAVAEFVDRSRGGEGEWAASFGAGNGTT